MGMPDVRSRPVIDDERLLDGADQVMLAPVKGPDRRREVPKTMFRKGRLRFTVKFTFALALIGGGYAAIALALDGRLGTVGGWVAIAAAIVVIGLTYGHLVELQHETLA